MASSLLRSTALRTAASPLLRLPCPRPRPRPRPAPALRTGLIGPTSLARIAAVGTAGSGSRAGMVTVTQTKAPSSADQALTAPAAPPEVTVTKSTSSDPSPPAEQLDQPNADGIIVTASCAQQIHHLASKRPDSDSVYLRVYVDAGGCSGFQYKFELESDVEAASDDGGDRDDDDDDDDEEEGGIDPDDDVIFTKDGARVVIDRASLDLVKGSTIDYVREMIRSSFAVVSNPLSESACGCGSSFAIKNFEENPAID